MKAITLHQPWASLVAIGAKNVETRPYVSNYRGPLAIHASKRPIRVCDPYYRSVLESAGLTYDRLPLGAVLAICQLTACEKIAPVSTPCYPEYAFGDFQPGWFAWKLTNIIAFKDTISALGRRGVWTWNP